MEAPRRYSVTPYYSFVTVPAHPVPSVAKSLRSVRRWLVDRQPTPTLKEQIRERQVVDLLAGEMAEEDGAGSIRACGFGKGWVEASGEARCGGRKA